MNKAIEEAMKALEAAIPKAQADPDRPVFHMLPPAQWCNDPNGPVYHNGYYHIFYQHCPFGDTPGQGRWQMYWGHARSKDLVRWEHLPIAIWPSNDLGENGCWSGTAAIRDDGVPFIIYTSVGPNKNAKDASEHWAATGDPELITWKKHPANPVLSHKAHKDVKIEDWRDPFIFREGKKWYMVIGGHRVGGKGCITLYSSDDLEKWEFLGIPFEGTEDNWEVPNLFKLGSKWVLTYSPYSTIKYYTGDFDLKTLKFKPEYQGTVDFSPNFYAMNCFQLEKGRRVLIAWIGAWENGFKPGRGWAGCMSLPRELSILPSGQLVQKPIGEFSKLRAKHYDGLHSLQSLQSLQSQNINTLEIQAEIEGESWEMKLGTLEDGGKLAIACSGKEIDVLGTKIPLEKPGKTFELHMFLDRTVLEILINSVSCTKVVYLKNLKHEFSGNFKKIDAWKIKSIW